MDSVTGEPVESHEKGRGYEIGENNFLMVEDAEVARARQARPLPGSVAIAGPARLLAPPPSRAPVSRTMRRSARTRKTTSREAEAGDEPIAPPVAPRPQNTRTIEIDRFVPQGQIDAGYFEKPYYIVPREPVGQEAFAVIRDAMRAKGVVGMARVVLSSRERPLLIEPMGNGLRGLTLRFAHEIRPEAEYFGDIPELVLPPEMVKLAEHIIGTKAEDFDPAILEDHYRNALVQMLREKQKQVPAQTGPVKPSAENVVSLMDALRRSLAAERAPAKPAPRRSMAPPLRKPISAKRPAVARAKPADGANSLAAEARGGPPLSSPEISGIYCAMPCDRARVRAFWSAMGA